MEALVVGGLLAFIGYLAYDETLGEAPVFTPRKRLCDYYVAGSVYEDIPTALARGVRLIEVHLYSDERDQPVIGMKAQSEGSDFADENVSFESACVDITNDDSEEPFILSIVPHTTKTRTLNIAADHLMTTMRRRLITTDKNLATMNLDALKGKILIVSGGTMMGTDLAPMVNMDWNGPTLRRLNYQQALHPRDPEELKAFNADHITIVAPDTELKVLDPQPLGCQWNLFDSTGSGFVDKTLAR